MRFGLLETRIGGALLLEEERKEALSWVGSARKKELLAVDWMKLLATRLEVVVSSSAHDEFESRFLDESKSSL